MRRLFLLLVLMLVSLMPGQALANGGPPRMLGDKTGMVLPGTSSQVHVLREELRFDVMRMGGADVTAVYELENRGGALAQYPVIFAIQTAHSSSLPTVTWNGSTVPVTKVEQDGLSTAQMAEMEKAWTAMDQVIDPATGELYSTQNFYARPTLQLYRFDLDLAAGVQGRLEVRYAQQSAVDRTRLLHRIYHYQYLLLPARAWASFGPLSITVVAPSPDEVLFRATLPMTYQAGAYHAQLPGLPDQNLAFALMSRQGMIFGVASAAPYFFTALLLLIAFAWLLGYGLGRLAGLIRSRGGAIAVALLGGLFVGGAVDMAASILSLALFSEALKEQGYGVAFWIVGQWFVATVITTVVAPIVAGRTNRRRAAVQPPTGPTQPPTGPAQPPQAPPA